MAIDEALIQEAIFPGNLEAYESLTQAVVARQLIPFVGAGASIPLYPSWTGALSQIVESVKSRGLVSDRELSTLSGQIASDPIELAASLEEILQRNNFRDMISSIFRFKGASTECHRAIIDLSARQIVTTNYDDGLEAAFIAKNRSAIHTIRSSDRAELTRWRQGRLQSSGQVPLLHWHGVPADPESMIFTADDYNRFYADSDNVSFLQQLWRDERFLAVGFSFSDPFLNRIADSVLRSLPSDNRHFALIGVPSDNQISSVSRRQFSRKFRLSPIFYEIKELNGVEDHSQIIRILQSLIAGKLGSPEGGAVPLPGSTIIVTSAAASTSSSPEAAGIALREFERGLLVFNDKQLYVEPHLSKLIFDPNGNNKNVAEEKISIEEVAKRNENIVILTQPEFGSTTLCKRLVSEIYNAGYRAIHKESGQLPAYKKKLEQEFSSVTGTGPLTLVLDSFDPAQHERLLKEVLGLTTFSRIIVISKRPSANIAESFNGGSYGAKFSVLNMSSLDRSDLRALASDMFDTSDQYILSMAVEKAYEDLLALCIPLTPANAIMYLSVLAREGDFSPLNRVQIVEHYVQDLLKKPSDAYQASFNARNRSDVVSALVYDLFSKGHTLCDDAIWIDFCRSYKEAALIDFDERGLLEDLLSARIFARQDGQIIFRYRFFYSYFLGRHVANRPALLKQMMENDGHLSTEGLVEVITAVGVDASIMVEDLLGKLKSSLDDVQAKYPLLDADPFSKIEWPTGNDEDALFWQPVFKKIASGPTDDARLDKLKRSVRAEDRTKDQSVTIIEFDKLESRVIIYMTALVAAINSSESLTGDQKKRSLVAIFDAYALVYIVGLVYAPIIAKYRIFYWNGIVINNSIEYTPEIEADEVRKQFIVCQALGPAVAAKAAAELGSRKLAEVYRLFAAEESWAGFHDLLIFSLLMRSKPKNWQSAGEKMIIKTNRKSFYLRAKLIAAFKQFDSEINTNGDREILKRLIAAIKVKRDLKKDAPGSKVISRRMEQLNASGAFAKNQSKAAPTQPKRGRPSGIKLR